MARFKDHRIPDGTMPQTAWKMLKDYLLEAETVEVITEYDEDDWPVGFWLRVWSGLRSDDSNAYDADPDKSY